MYQQSIVLGLLGPCLLFLASCSAPPKPPTVDESRRRPVNTATAVELQTCQSDLANTRILARESADAAEATAVNLQRLAARQQRLAVEPVRQVAPQANSVYSIRFEFGSSRVVLPAEMAAALVEEARSAPLVIVRGRTDGESDAASESRVARDRAAAVRNYLIAAGVDAGRVRTMHQPVGDHIADNRNALGRSANRRAEIEVYRVAPIAVGVAPGAHVQEQGALTDDFHARTTE